MWYNSLGMIYGWYSAGYSLMELVASPDSPAMVTGDVSGRNSVLIHIDGVETEEDASAITSITWSVRSPTGALMDYPLDPDIVFQSLPPLPAGRRLRFFEEGKEYLFFRFQIPQEMLTEPGAGAITPRFKVGEDFKAGTLLTYAVFKGNANDEDSLITKSQYDYLLAYVDRGITEEEGDNRWVMRDPGGDTASQRLQPILGDIRITSTMSSIPPSYLQLVSWGGSPSIAGKRNGEAYATSLRFFPAEGHLSANAILNTPDEGGTLATREWVNEHAQPEEPEYILEHTIDDLDFIKNSIRGDSMVRITDSALHSFLSAGEGRTRLTIHIIVGEQEAPFVFVMQPVLNFLGNWFYAEVTFKSSLGDLGIGLGDVNSFRVSLFPSFLDAETTELHLTIIPEDTEEQGEEPTYDVSFTADQLFFTNAMGNIGQAIIKDASLRTFLNGGKGKVNLTASVEGLPMEFKFTLVPNMWMGASGSGFNIWTAEVTKEIDLTQVYGGKVNTFKLSMYDAVIDDEQCFLNLSISSVEAFCGREMRIQHMDYCYTMKPQDLPSLNVVDLRIPSDDGADVTLATREWVNSTIDISWEDYPD